MQPTTYFDLSPKGIAEALDTWVAATMESDREVAAILASAREAFRALSWERFRLRHEERSRQAVAAKRRTAFIVRHQSRQGGRNHA